MTARSAAKGIVKLLVLGCLIFLAVKISEAISAGLDIDLMPHNEAMINKVILVGLGTYVALMATPFLPGAEIGIALLAGFGASIAPAVYVATVIALTLSYFVGRLVPPETTIRFLRTIGLVRTAARMQDMSALTYDELIGKMTSAKNLTGWLCRYRYLTAILLINLPGNILIGGGGGIAMAAGMSRLFHPVGFFVAVLIGVLPVPLAFLMMGAT